jgi:OmpA-OmpF porin, OOP family
MEKLVQVLAGSLLLATAAASHAGEGGAYVGGQAGMFLPIESSVTGSFVGSSGKLAYNPGVVLAAVGGYQFGNGIRSEGELNFRHLTTDKLVTSGGPVAVDSDIWSCGVMTNVYYDFRTRTAVTPYLGAGVGLVVVDFGKGTSNGTARWTPDKDVSVAYQGIAGFALRIGSQTSLDFVYHHYAVPQLHFDTLAAQFRGLNLSLGVRHWF